MTWISLRPRSSSTFRKTSRRPTVRKFSDWHIMVKTSTIWFGSSDFLPTQTGFQFGSFPFHGTQTGFLLPSCLCAFLVQPSPSPTRYGIFTFGSPFLPLGVGPKPDSGSSLAFGPPWAVLAVTGLIFKSRSRGRRPARSHATQGAPPGPKTGGREGLAFPSSAVRIRSLFDC
jgi:hypothetical protein